MLFKSRITPKTWDTGLYYHDGSYYLYYLISDQHPGDGFCVATSPDGLHWEDHGWALRHSDKMVRYLGGTGPVWKDLSTADEIQFETDQGIVLEGKLNLPGSLTIHTGDGAGAEIRTDEKGVMEEYPFRTPGIQGCGNGSKCGLELDA
jgi:hypothetical protein